MADENDVDDRPLSGELRPPDWKGMDDFAAGIDGNRLPATELLAGQELTVSAPGRPDLHLSYLSADRVAWTSGDEQGTDWYEAIAVRPHVLFQTITFDAKPLEAAVLVVNTETRRTLHVESVIAPRPTPGRPRVSQTFTAVVLAGTEPGGTEPGGTEPGGSEPGGSAPGPTRDLIGWRALYRYSPNHLYEHVYLSSERYAWQCLVGEQRGHGDVDLATTWSLGDSLYVFTFREFLIPVAATWLYDLDQMRSTGTFFGLASDGRVQRAPGGAFISELGRVVYPDDQPV